MARVRGLLSNVYNIMPMIVKVPVFNLNQNQFCIIFAGFVHNLMKHCKLADLDFAGVGYGPCLTGSWRCSKNNHKTVRKNQRHWIEHLAGDSNPEPLD